MGGESSLNLTSPKFGACQEYWNCFGQILKQGLTIEPINMFFGLHIHVTPGCGIGYIQTKQSQKLKISLIRFVGLRVESEVGQ